MRTFERLDLVVDASLATKRVIHEPYSSEARNLLQEWAQFGDTLHKHAVLPAEVSSALCKRAKQGELRPEQVLAVYSVHTGPISAASAAPAAGPFVSPDLALTSDSGIAQIIIQAAASMGRWIPAAAEEIARETALRRYMGRDRWRKYILRNRRAPLEQFPVQKVR